MWPSLTFLDRGLDALAKVVPGDTGIESLRVGPGESCTIFARRCSGACRLFGTIPILEFRCFHDSAPLGSLSCNGFPGSSSGTPGATHRLYAQGPSRERLAM